jgi:hypothetical protein
MHFSTNFWSYRISNRCSAKKNLAGRALCRAVAPRPSVSALVRHPRRPSPEAARRPKTRSSLGRPRPRHTSTCHTRRAGRMRTTQPSGPSAASLPHASYYGQSITLSSPLIGPPLFKHPPFLLAPPDPAPAAPPRPPWPPPSKPPPCSPLGHRACK